MRYSLRKVQVKLFLSFSFSAPYEKHFFLKMIMDCLIRGDYDYCRVPGTWQLSPLEVGEDNSKFEPKTLRKIQIHQYGQTKGSYRGF